MAVRNAEGSYYVCQAMQNIYKSSSKIKIRWLSKDTNGDNYTPDFYDHTGEYIHPAMQFPILAAPKFTMLL